MVRCPAPATSSLASARLPPHRSICRPTLTRRAAHSTCPLRYPRRTRRLTMWRGFFRPECNLASRTVQEEGMNTPMPENRCPQCGALLTPGAAQGLCPRCLLADAAAPPEQTATGSKPPTLELVAAAFPHLEVIELIGHGGMGAVFKVRQSKLDRYAALKILPQSLAVDAAFASRFEREARLLARLNHPNIVAVYDHGQAGEFFYLLMEFVDGVNLRQTMRAARFTPDQALAIVPKICEALQYAHDESVLHRDIKPENILLDAKGRVKLADFGIAKLAVPESAPGDPQWGTQTL